MNNSGDKFTIEIYKDRRIQIHNETKKPRFSYCIKT